jgi:hypothetical protein
MTTEVANHRFISSTDLDGEQSQGKLKVKIKKYHGDSSSNTYRKTKIDCLRFVMCPLLALVLQGFFYVATKSTN